MIKPTIVMLFLAASFVLIDRGAQGATAASAVAVKSPDGNLVLTIEIKANGKNQGCLFYRVDYKGRTVLADSQLGLNLKDLPSLKEGFRIAGSHASAHDETWTPVCGERSTYRDHYNELRLDLEDSQSPPRKLGIVTRAYDEGAAFYYVFPEQQALQAFTVAAEDTRFQFTGDYTAWAVYSAQGDYAGLREPGGPTPLSKIKPGAERPMPVRIADDLYVALAEARGIGYARMKFRPVPGIEYALESALDGTVALKTPCRSPWRVVMVAESPGKLLENNSILLNLNDPCVLKDVSWIKPGKVIRDGTLSTDGGKSCVDFCVAHNMQYVLFDARWYGPEHDPKSDARKVNVIPKKGIPAKPLDLQEVIRYGKERGIGVILYVNHIALEQQIDDLLPLYEKWGVCGLKFGFVNVGSQRWTDWLLEAVRKCAAHRLMVDVHDEYRPTGYQRTYPNWMTVEGIRGNEAFPTPIHDATLPFTRFLAGPADYTFCWYNERLKNSHAHQLAISVIYYSPWQVLYWYDTPEQFRGEKELEFWDGLPTVWDDTRVINGQIGEYVTVARRNGQQWWVGTIDAVKGKPLSVPLAFLDADKKYQATIYTDADANGSVSRPVKIATRAVDRKTVITVDIPSNGGHAMRIVPLPPR